MDNRLNNVALPQHDTCNWLFETPEFTKWKDLADIQDHNGVLWIKGHPGVGKSTLMKHTLSYCKENFENYAIASYFFNARGAVLERSPLGLMRSLLI